MTAQRASPRAVPDGGRRPDLVREPAEDPSEDAPPKRSRKKRTPKAPRKTRSRKAAPDDEANAADATDTAVKAEPPAKPEAPPTGFDHPVAP